ncbi:MAG: putative aminohydrolase SsnA [Anaerolinea sp.]|mgnify:CR=1 FL=1|nr:putative aminohydrolase SsnA [Anaerolinea sp.]
MLIKNATVISWENPNQILPGQGVLVQDGKVVEIGDVKELLQQNPGEEVLDAQGQYLMPGNICAHTHFYGAFARGMAIGGGAPADFPQILERLWWPLDRALTLEDVRFSTLVCLADAIRHGTTTLVDHHASPNAIDGSLDVIADAVEQAGVRASLCYEVTDRNGADGARRGIEENVRFARRIAAGRNADGRLSAMFGLHASLTVGEETMAACRAAAPTGIGFHIHVAEHSVDEYDSLQRYGERVVDRLYRHGLLGEDSIVVHGVHLDVAEIGLLAQTKTWVTHQPRSNMNNAVGLPWVEAMLRAGVRVCLGNDGFSNAMWEEWKTAYLAHKLWNLDPRRMGGEAVVQMGVYHNAALASRLFPETRLGVVAPGAAADLILVDYHPFTELTEQNLPWHILFGFHESMVTMTMVAGKLLMKDRVLLTLDEAHIAQEARRLSANVWERYRNQF